MILKTVFNDDREKLKAKAKIFGIITPLLFFYWLYSYYKAENSNFLLFVLLFYFITTIIINLYTFIGNIIVTKKFIFVVEFPFKYTLIRFKKIVSVEKNNIDNEVDMSNIEIFGFSNSTLFPITIYKNNGSICKIWCEKPDKLFSSIITNQVM